MLQPLVATALLLSASAQAVPTSIEERADELALLLPSALDDADPPTSAGIARTCPTGQYFLTSKCVPCTSTFDDASTCKSSGALSCSTKFFDPTTKRCVAVCPDGFYGKDNVCSPCSGRWLGSSTCTATGATGCRSPRFLRDGKCVTACPAGTFGAETGSRACTPCSKVDFHATTCTPTEALSCALRTKLFRGKCLGNCPSATFVSSTPSGLSCSDCPVHALTCTSTEVLTCETNYFPLGDTCGPVSKAYYRIPGVASSAAGNFDFLSIDATTERQCVDFCATHANDFVEYNMNFRLFPALCTCSNDIFFGATAKAPGTTSLYDARYWNHPLQPLTPCTDERLNPYGVCELVEYRGETCYVKGTNTPCAGDPENLTT